MEIIEIILYAIVAFFVINKLRSVFGIEVISEENNSKYKENGLLDNDVKNEQNIKQNENDAKEFNASKKNINDKEEDLSKYFCNENISDLLNKIEKIKKIYPDFLLKNFLNTATVVYELIIKAFCDQDCQQIQNLCSEDIYHLLSEKIKKLKQKNHLQKIKIIHIKALIIDITINENIVSIVINFSSNQFSYVENNNNELISGNKSKDIEVIEYFTFIKKINDHNKQWMIQSINI